MIADRAPPSASEFVHLLGERMEAIIGSCQNRRRLIEAILDQADRTEIHGASNLVRTEPVWVFVQDLLLENPSAFEWAQIARLRVNPRSIKTEDDLLDVLIRHAI
jgi:hypothetical protein